MVDKAETIALWLRPHSTNQIHRSKPLRRLGMTSSGSRRPALKLTLIHKGSSPLTAERLKLVLIKSSRLSNMEMKESTMWRWRLRRN